MTSTYDTLASRLQTAFDAVAPERADPVLRSSDRGDYQANGVMALAKRLDRPPREVAEEILRHLDLEGVAEAQIAGPGFINLTLSPSYLNGQLRSLLDDDRVGVSMALVASTVVIDYSAPNVAKEMHVPVKESVPDLEGWNKVGRGTPLHTVLETKKAGEDGTNYCVASIASMRL